VCRSFHVFPWGYLVMFAPYKLITGWAFLPVSYEMVLHGCLLHRYKLHMMVVSFSDWWTNGANLMIMYCFIEAIWKCHLSLC
jgi:hypothetical protein